MCEHTYPPHHVCRYNANMGLQWKWWSVTVTKRFPMRKQSYYTAMKLYSVYGRDNNHPFTNQDACATVGRWICGGLAALRDAGVIILTSGRKRSVLKRKWEPPTTWHFTSAFIDYMRTDDGQEELQIALDFLNRNKAKLEQPACA